LSVPGVLNNAIDWASTAYGVDSFNGKPVAIVSAPIGMPRGAREIFVFLNIYPVNAPEVIVTFANDVFDTNGKLLHENTS
jgi:chromate reductase